MHHSSDRVTATSATLIDTIFTNNLMDISHSLHELFITDVSDHFPIFSCLRRMQTSDVDVYKYKRLFSLKNKEFYHAVSTTNWDEIDRATDTQQPFDLFHNQLTEWHNKHFPKVRIKKKYSNRKPCITGFDAEACWPLNGPLFSPLNPLYSLMGVGVTGPPLSTNWSGRVLHAIYSVMAVWRSEKLHKV